LAKVTLGEMGALLRERRGTRGVRETATEIGVSAATLSRVENGKQPDLQTFEKICRWLGLSPSDVLNVGASKGAVVPVSSGVVSASAHLKARQQISPKLAQALGEMILRGQAMLADDSRPDEA